MSEMVDDIICNRHGRLKKLNKHQDKWCQTQQQIPKKKCQIFTIDKKNKYCRKCNNMKDEFE